LIQSEIDKEIIYNLHCWTDIFFYVFFRIYWGHLKYYYLMWQYFAKIVFFLAFFGLSGPLETVYKKLWTLSRYLWNFRHTRARARTQAYELGIFSTEIASSVLIKKTKIWLQLVKIFLSVRLFKKLSGSFIIKFI